MATNPHIASLIDRVRRDEIGGAADTAKEVIDALAKLVRDSGARDAKLLVAEVDDAILEIMRVMPSLAPVINALHRFVGCMERAEAEGATVDGMKMVLEETRNEFFEWANNALDRLAQYGAEKVADGDRVFMYSMSSSVWRILRKAKEQAKSFEVVVTESRPAKEGLWTVREMERFGIPVSVTIDACIGELIPKCHIALAGADVVAATGHVLNKAGTYPSALVAKAFGVPFYVAADTLKFDTATLYGLRYRNQPIQRHEVLDGSFSDQVRVVGDLFDETPPELITGIITELGILHPAATYAVLREMTLSPKVARMLPAWSRGEL